MLSTLQMTVIGGVCGFFEPLWIQNIRTIFCRKLSMAADRQLDMQVRLKAHSDELISHLFNRCRLCFTSAINPPLAQLPISDVYGS